MNELSPSSLHTRPSLLLRVRDWADASSWEEFYRLYRKLVYGLARRSGLAHADAEDVCQEVFQRLAQTIHRFEADPNRGSFRGWVMNLTRWRIADRFAARAADRRAEPGATALPAPDLDQLPAPAEIEEAWNREWQEHALATALERLARRTKPRHFQVFDLYIRQHWPVLRVASELGVNPASVYLIGHRLTQQLKLEVARLHRQLG